MRHVTIAISGASGSVYGIRALELLKQVGDVETHVIISPAALRTAQLETGLCAEQIRALADHAHSHRDIGDSLASGSARSCGMLIAPCSVKTLSGIANCYDDNLIIRAADVCLKERRPLVLMLRETPLHAGHIALMDQVTRSGAIVMPPVPAFYTQPQTIDDMVTQTAGRALDLLGFDLPEVTRWRQDIGPDVPAAATSIAARTRSASCGGSANAQQANPARSADRRSRPPLLPVESKLNSA